MLSHAHECSECAGNMDASRHVDIVIVQMSRDAVDVLETWTSL